MQRFLSVLLAALALSACATQPLRPRLDANSLEMALAEREPDGRSTASSANADVANILHVRPQGLTTWGVVAAFDAAPPPDAAARRVSLGYYLLDVSDAECGEYLKDAFRAQRTWRTSLSVAGTLFGAAGALATPARTASLLAGLAGASSGVRGNLDEGLLAGQAAYLIRNSVLAAQEERRDELVGRLRAGDYMTAANVVADAQVYHSRCHVSEGIAFLAERSQDTDNDDADDSANDADDPPSNP
jgi:hypothetical protein